MQRITESSKYLRLLFNAQKLLQGSQFTTTIDDYNILYSEPFQKHKSNDRIYSFKNDFNIRYFMGMESNRQISVEKMTIKDITIMIQDCLTKNKDKQIIKTIKDCLDKQKVIGEELLKQLFIHYSVSGKVDAVEVLQKYCNTLNPNLYKRRGEFLHYLAKAQCMKGNSEKGLTILKEAYAQYEGLRRFYRTIFNELIYDSIQNRSEASNVIFKKYVMEFSNIWNDNYPLVCFWHTCWSSTWFSDQVMSDELLDTSVALRDIIRDKATTFSINILRDYNEDAVIRLCQTLLKYKMMEEYVNVLQILFSYKLKYRDLRGCTEILRNCQTLGVSLPSYQQGRYIKLLINSTQSPVNPDDKQIKPESENFKLKF